MPPPCLYLSACFGPGDQKAVTASGCQLAMGRVVGSLCVLTAGDEDATSAMLASWVSQVRVAGRDAGRGQAGGFME